jgi:hypothetical protein
MSDFITLSVMYFAVLCLGFHLGWRAASKRERGEDLRLLALGAYRGMAYERGRVPRSAPIDTRRAPGQRPSADRASPTETRAGAHTHVIYMRRETLQ